MTTMITARVDSEKRKAAEKVFDEVGLTTSAAVNIFICAVAASGGIPFAVGNQMMAAGMSRWNGNVRTFAEDDEESKFRARRASEFRRLIESLPKSGRNAPYQFSRDDANFRESRSAK